MTTVDRSVLEKALTAQLGSGPTPVTLERLDVLVHHVIELAAARPPSRARWSPLARRGLLLGIALAAFVTMAAGGLGMLDRLFNGNWPGWEHAWLRSEEIGLSHVIDGHQVTVERAYMDGLQTIIGISTDGSAYPVGDLLVDGTPAVGGLSAGDSDRRQSAGVLVFHTPDGTGPVAHLELRVGRADDLGSPGTVARDWSFTFDLSNHGGGTWNGLQRVTDSGAGVTLSALSVSPTRISGQLAFDGDKLSTSDDAWSPHGWVEHGDRRFPIGSGAGGNRDFEFTIRDGVDDPSGTWKVVVTELTSDPGNPSTRVGVAGPWEFSVDVQSFIRPSIQPATWADVARSDLIGWPPGIRRAGGGLSARDPCLPCHVSYRFDRSQVPCG